MKIWLGPAGNAISARKETAASLKYLKEIGLNAQEIEFVRNIYLNKEKARKIGEIAKSLGIKLSVHAPYYINLNSEKTQVIKKSKFFILESLDRANEMKAEYVVIHPAYYGNLKTKAYENVKTRILEILDEAKERGIKSKLALETMGRKSQFGSLDELINLCKEIRNKQLTICIDFAHIFVRNNGKISYSEIFDKLKDLKLKQISSHFSNVKYNLNKKEFVDIHIPINSHPPFKDLAKEILKRKVNITIISESPALEKDSLKMKKVFEKLGYKF